MQAVEVQNMAEVDVNGKTVKIALKKVW
jgi:hypothetical protein